MNKADYIIMLVDDDVSYARTWVERAFDDYRIELVHYEDWESAYTHLIADPERYNAIVLDAKGKLTQDDPSSSMSHVIRALQELKKLEGKGMIIPYVVNTGYFDDTVTRALRDVKIFSKGKEEIMFRYLIDLIKGLPEYKIRKRNPGLFDVFRMGFLPPGEERRLINIFLFAENPSWQKAPDDFFTPARKILESIFWKLKDEKKIDERCFTGKEIKLTACIQYIGGYTAIVGLTKMTNKKLVPIHIYKSMAYVNEITSTFSHQYLEETDVSHYALQSVVTALCEILYWFKSFIEDLENKKPNNNAHRRTP